MTIENEVPSLWDRLKVRVDLAMKRLGFGGSRAEEEALSSSEGRLNGMWTKLKKVAELDSSKHPGGWKQDVIKTITGATGVFFGGFMQWGGEKARVEFGSASGFWSGGGGDGHLENGILQKVAAQVRLRNGEAGFIAMDGVLDPRLELHNAALPESIRQQGVDEVVVDSDLITAWMGNELTTSKQEPKYGDPQILVGYRQSLAGGEGIDEVMIHVDSWPSDPKSDGAGIAESRWIKLKRDSAGEQEWGMVDKWGREAQTSCRSDENGSVALEFIMGNAETKCKLPLIDPVEVLKVGERFVVAVGEGYLSRIMSIG